MIVTVTPNPSIDRTLRVPTLHRGEVIRASAPSSEAGGKGINVARALATMGIPAVAIAPASAATRAMLDPLIARSVTLRTVPIEGEIRVNLSIVEPDGTVTKVNEPGPTLSTVAAARLIDDVVDAALEAFGLDGVGRADDARADDAQSGEGADDHELADRASREVHWLVGSGSLSPGLPDTFYADIADRMPPGVRVAVDADRGALRAVAGARVALLKPNRVELAELVGGPLTTLGDVLDAAAGLIAAGVGQVLVSLGVDGALAVDPFSACHAEAAIDDVANTVGAGDALLAGYLAGGATLTALPEAVAWSIAACRAAGTRMPAVSARDRAAVVAHATIDRDRQVRG